MPMDPCLVRNLVGPYFRERADLERTMNFLLPLRCAVLWGGALSRDTVPIQNQPCLCPELPCTRVRVKETNDCAVEYN